MSVQVVKKQAQKRKPADAAGGSDQRPCKRQV